VSRADETHQFSTDCSPPPCFYWKSCRRPAAVEQQGKSVCHLCAQRLKGIAYPLRPPSRAPLYQSGWEVARDVDMLEAKDPVASATDDSP